MPDSIAFVNFVFRLEDNINKFSQCLYGFPLNILFIYGLMLPLQNEYIYCLMLLLGYVIVYDFKFGVLERDKNA